MSTRCQVIVKDQWEELWFYRHCDGCPEGIKESLELFLSLVKEGKLRDNAEQSSGWLIIIGYDEFGGPTPGSGGKVGSYEPCAPREHDDIRYLYTIDLVKKEITYKDVNTGVSGIAL